MKKFAVAFLLAGVFASGIAFAVPDVKFSTYGKVTIGGSWSNMRVLTTFDDHSGVESVNTHVTGFELTPAIGFMLPIGGDVVWGCQRFAVEAQVPVNLNFYSWLDAGHYWANHYYHGGEGRFGVSLDPGAVFIWNYYPPRAAPAGLQKLSLQLGAGVSVPIYITNGTYWRDGYSNSGSYNGFGVGFRMNFLSGVRYDFTEHFSVLAEWNVGFIGGSSSSGRIGVLWRF